MKKALAVLLSVTLLCTVASGFSSKKPTAQTKAVKTVTCKYVVPGTAPTDNAKVLKLINAKLAKDKVGVKLVTQYIPWDSWDSKLNIMLSTGQKFDMFQVMNDRTSLSNYQARGALANITGDIKKYGKNISKYNSPVMMKSGQVSGKQYAIPAYWFESSINPQITIRLDILRKYGIKKVPTTFTELTNDYVKIMKAWKGSSKPYLPLLGSNCFDFGACAKTYSAWPYTIYQNMIYVSQTGTVKDFFETQAFKQDCANARKWYKLGLINPDVITYTSDQLNNQLNTGNWFIYFGTYGNSIDNIKKYYPNIKVSDFGFIDLAPNKPNLRPYGTRNMNAVPKSSSHPYAAVKLINWIYANQSNYDLFLYGRQGIDYTKVGSRSRKDIVNQATSTPLYYFSDWMIGNLHFERTATGTPTITNKLLYREDKKAVNGIAAQLTFDASKVQTQMADVNTVMSSNIVPLATGVQDYNGNYAKAVKLLKQAGVGKIVSAFKQQYAAMKAKH